MSSASASVVELADDWLTAKRALESAAQAEKGHSDRARRADLERWAVVLGEVRGPLPHCRPATHRGSGAERSLRGDAARRHGGGEAEVVRRHGGSHALDAARLHPLAAPGRTPFRRSSRRRPLPGAGAARAVAEGARHRGRRADAFRRRRGAGLPPAHVRPIRDVALLRFLATTERGRGGARGDHRRVQPRAERPIWRVGRAKGGKPRDVPLPRTTLDAIDDWLGERVRPGEGQWALKARRTDPLFVRPNGTSLSPQALDRVVRELAHRAGVVPARRSGGACFPPPLRRHLGPPPRAPGRNLPAHGPRRPSHDGDLHHRGLRPAHRRPRRRRPARLNAGLGAGCVVVGRRRAGAVRLRRAGPPVRELPR